MFPLLASARLGEAVSSVMTRRILIVDDHAGFRRSASRNLASAGWEVIGEAEDGAAALAAAERFEPDVVLLDVGLPDVSGIEVARRLHERLPDVAVVMISTQDREDYGELALASGARGFLTKLDLSSQALEALVES
jgi:DNA-binding NarL/FixJ family response regulator